MTTPLEAAQRAARATGDPEAVKRIEALGTAFLVRPAYSDEKAVRFIYDQHGYRRKGFPDPTWGEKWLDLGANSGAFAVLAGRNNAHVVAFEPDPGTARIAAMNIGLHRLENRVALVEAAVAVGPGPGEDWQLPTTVTLHRNTANGNVRRNSLERTWRGGDDIVVPLVDLRDWWGPGVCVKMNIEGTEMPILEALAEQPVKRLAVEWSFDVDPSITRFEAVVERLRKVYRHVEHGGYLPGYEVWPASWFPPARVIWAW